MCVFVPWNTVLFSLQMYILTVCLTFSESLKMQNWHQKQASSAGRGLCLFWNYCSIRRSLDARRHWYLRFLTCWAGNCASITQESLSFLFCTRHCQALTYGLLSLCFVAMFCSLPFSLLLGKSDDGNGKSFLRCKWCDGLFKMLTWCIAFYVLKLA